MCGSFVVLTNRPLCRVRAACRAANKLYIKMVIDFQLPPVVFHPRTPAFMESPLVLQEQKVNTEAAGDAIVKGSEPKRARVEEKSTRLPCTFTTSSSTARAPSYGSAAAAGADLHASLAASVPAKGKALISTGLHIALPTGHYGRVAPRSGLAAKNFIDVGAGVVDEDYRGELKVVLFNHADTDFAVAEGDRIAQFICEKYIQDFESAPRTEEGSKTTCRFVKLNDRASSPVYSKEGAVGAQLKAAEEAVVPARGKACIGTGLQVELPDEHYGRVASLTDLAEGHGLKAGAGVVDSDYRGELKVLLFNHSDTDFDVTIGTPIAQLVCQHVALLNFAETTELPTTARGAGGFGSTGVAEQKENAPAEKEERTSSLTLLREGARLPVYGSLAAAGADLHANEAAIVPAGGRALIGTGLGLAALPAGYYARVAPRSGLAAKNSIDVGAGVISGDHEGEIKVLLFNYGSTEFAVSMGDRIAQLIYEKTTKLSYEEASSLDETARGEGGFGSTGVSAQ